MKSKAAFVICAIPVLGICQCSADDIDTSRWMHPVMRWEQRERSRVAIHTIPASTRKQIVVPDLTLHGVSLAEAVNLLRQASAMADNPTHEGTTFHLADGLSESKANTHITMTFHNVPLSEVARYVASAAECRIIEAPNEFVFVAK